MNIDEICYEFDDKCYINIRNSLAKYLKEKIDYLMLLHKYKKIIILCFGTNLIKDDSYSPIIGSILAQSEFNENISVFGTMQNTLNATNIESFIYQNASIIDESLVIAIDSTISKYHAIGSIIVSNDGLNPGSGVNKSFPKIGDFSIRGVTSNDSKIYDRKNMNIVKFIEGNTNIKKLKQMCNITADALFMALGIEMNSEKIITECIGQIENMIVEREELLAPYLTTKEKRKLKRLHYKMNK